VIDAVGARPSSGLKTRATGSIASAAMYLAGLSSSLTRPLAGTSVLSSAPVAPSMATDHAPGRPAEKLAVKVPSFATEPGFPVRDAMW